MSQSVNSPRDAPGGRWRLLTGFVHLDVMNRETIHFHLITHTSSHPLQDRGHSCHGEVAVIL